MIIVTLSRKISEIEIIEKMKKKDSPFHFLGVVNPHLPLKRVKLIQRRGKGQELSDAILKAVLVDLPERSFQPVQNIPHSEECGHLILCAWPENFKKIDVAFSKLKGTPQDYLERGLYLDKVRRPYSFSLEEKNYILSSLRLTLEEFIECLQIAELFE